MYASTREELISHIQDYMLRMTTDENWHKFEFRKQANWTSNNSIFIKANEQIFTKHFKLVCKQREIIKDKFDLFSNNKLFFNDATIEICPKTVKTSDEVTNEVWKILVHVDFSFTNDEKEKKSNQKFCKNPSINNQTFYEDGKYFKISNQQISNQILNENSPQTIFYELQNIYYYSANAQLILLRFVYFIVNHLTIYEWNLEKIQNVFDISQKMFLNYIKRKFTSNYVLDIEYVEKVIFEYENIEFEIFAKKLIKDITASSNSLVHNKLQMLCNWMQIKYKCYQENETNDREFQLFQIIINNCDHCETLFTVILTIENVFGKLKFNDEQRKILTKKLDCMSTYFKQIQYPLFTEDFDLARWTLGFCARWCIDNVFGCESSRMAELPLLKLSADNFTVRNENNAFNYLSIRSSFPIYSGIYYYEVIAFTNGEIRFGWLNQEFLLGQNEPIGHNDSECSINLNLEKGTTVGCLINITKFDETYDSNLSVEFSFYRNGKLVKSSKLICFPQPYFAVASLTFGQQCYFNFGQTPFRHISTDIQNVRCIYSEFNNSIETALFLQPNIFGEYQWFKQKQCIPFQKDLNYDIHIDTLMESLSDYTSNFPQNLIEIETSKKNNIKYQYLCIIQLMIDYNLFNFEIFLHERNKSMDVFAQKYYYLFRIVFKQIESVKIIELLYPYLHLRVIPNKDQTKIRNVCIHSLILCFKQYDEKALEEIRKEVFNYLKHTFVETSDKWSRLFVLICLEELKLSENEIKELNVDKRFQSTLNRYLEFGALNNDKNNVYEYLCENVVSELAYQMYFCAIRLKSQLDTLSPQIISKSKLDSQATLNDSDATRQIKLSTDLLSARSDSKWQSIRSACSVGMSERSCYFEAIFLTKGQCIIGWSTIRTILNKTKIGFDASSIGFDGFNDCVWSNGIKCEVSTDFPPQWEPQDVVGCFIDMKAKSFSFYLNGKSIFNSKDVSVTEKHYQDISFSTNLPYFASVSLDIYQQCYFNFGQSPFKYQPNQKDFLDFNLIIEHSKQKEQKNSKTQISINNSNIEDTQLSVHSKVNTGDVTTTKTILSNKLIAPKCGPSKTTLPQISSLNQQREDPPSKRPRIENDSEEQEQTNECTKTTESEQDYSLLKPYFEKKLIEFKNITHTQSIALLSELDAVFQKYSNTNL